MRDALKSYLALAAGVTDITRQRALAAAKALVSQGEATAEQVTGLAEDLVVQTRQNREAVVALVSFEVDRALGRLGLATTDEVTQLTERIRELEAQLRESRAAAGAAGATAKAPAEEAAATSPAKTAPAKTAPAKKAPAKKAPAKKAPAKKAPAKKAPAKAAGSPAEKPPAKKAPAGKASSTTTAKATGDDPADAAGLPGTAAGGVQQDLLSAPSPEPGESPA